jgi:DnaJ homolog subfamily B member 4
LNFIRKSTKITFPGLGKDTLGSPLFDLIYVVIERPHTSFKRDENDLMITQKISLLEALVEKILYLTTLDGRDITIHLTGIVTPCYEKVVSSECMPLSKDSRKRRKLIIKFVVVFPSRLATQQKLDLRRILCG